MWRRNRPSMATVSLRMRPPAHGPAPSSGSSARGDWEGPVAMREVLKGLHALRVPLALDAEVRSSGRRSLTLTIPRADLPTVRRFLWPVYRGWAWEERPSGPPHRAWRTGRVARIVRSGGRGEGPYPELSPGELPGWTPWEGFLRLVLEPGWEAWMRLVLTPAGSSLPRPLPAPDPEGPRSPPHEIGREMLNRTTQRTLEPRWRAGGIVLLWNDERPRSLPASRRGATRGVTHASLGSAVLRAGARTAQPDRDSERLSRLLSALSTNVGGGGFRLSWARTRWGSERVARALLRADGLVEGAWGSLRDGFLTCSEVARWLPPRELRDTWLLTAPETPGGIVLGHDPLGTPVRLSWSPKEGHHLLVAGETGLGKSTLLTHLATKVYGPDTSIIVFDPLGESVRDLAAALPERARGECLLISPRRAPLALNALAPPRDPSAAREEGRSRRVKELVSAFRTVRAERYGETFYWGPRIEDILTRVFLLLSYCPGATLEDALRLVRGDGGPDLPPDLPIDPARWRTMQEELRQEKPEDMSGARRVLSEVTLSAPLSRMLNARNPRWDLSETLVPGRVTLLSLDRPDLGGRDSSYLGSVLLSLLWSQISSGSRERSKVVLVLDEVQEYANASLGEMLRLGRRYNLHVWLATQSLASLSADLRDTLVTNARDIVLFRGSPADARLAVDTLGLAEARDLLTLPRGRAIAFLEKAAQVTPVNIPAPSTPTAAGKGNDVLEGIARATLDRWEGPSSSPGVPPGGEEVAPAEPGDGLFSIVRVLASDAGSGEAGTPFEVPMRRLVSLAGGDVRRVRALGALLKGTGALVRSERRDGERVWVLTRDGLEHSLPRPSGEPERKPALAD